MGTIEILGKYDLKTNAWYKPNSISNMLTSLSLVSYKPIIKNESNNINYVIVIDGCRLENYSKNPYEISEKKGHIFTILDYFEKSDKNTQVQLLLVDKDAPLSEESIIVAKLIDSLACKDNVSSISIIGTSKGGLIAYNAMKHLKNPQNKNKTSVYAYSAPYKGTILASPLYLRNELSRYINAKLPTYLDCELIVDKIMEVYNRIGSDSHMDYDLCEKGGMPLDKLDRCDESFLDNIFSKENISSIFKVHIFQNICALANDEVLKESIRKMDTLDIGLCVLNNILLGGSGDGFVPLSSSLSINKEAGVYSHLYASTHRLIKKNDNLDRTLGMLKSNMR